jgi:hypothetical protein
LKIFDEIFNISKDILQNKEKSKRPDRYDVYISDLFYFSLF